MTSKREKEIISFICTNYCQTCDNNTCNVQKIMEKYESNWLTPSQMNEVNEFELDGASCRNHVSNGGLGLFGHIIRVHYMDGRVEKKDGWYTEKAISKIWDDSVEWVEILFTEI